MAHQYSNGALSIREAHRIFGVNYSALNARVKHGALPRKIANQKMQKLFAGEEDALTDWTNLLTSWGWSAQISQLRIMANELLQAKEVKEPLATWAAIA